MKVNGASYLRKQGLIKTFFHGLVYENSPAKFYN